MVWADRARHGNLLCAVPFPANTGYAWTFIEGLYAAVANRVAADAIITYVAYPAIDASPRTLTGSPAQAVVLDTSLRSLRSLWQSLRFLRAHDVRTLYLTDRRSRSLANWWFRLSGVRWIVIHDHTSGARVVPTGLRYMTKWLLARVPALVADRVITVSDYVADRQVRVNLVPRNRVRRIWNGISLPPLPEPVMVARIRAELGLCEEQPLIVCCCRAASEKGVDHLLIAFDRLAVESKSPRPVLAYVGDGPQLDELRALRAQLRSCHDIRLLGYRENPRDYLGAADVCVVPSVWQDALPLGVLEAMSLAKPVVASNVGGIPEMLRHDREGLLVPPADPQALALALQRLLAEPSRARAQGVAGRNRVAKYFDPEFQISAIIEQLRGESTKADPLRPSPSRPLSASAPAR